MKKKCWVIECKKKVPDEKGRSLCDYHFNEILRQYFLVTSLGKFYDKL